MFTFVLVASFSIVSGLAVGCSSTTTTASPTATETPVLVPQVELSPADVLAQVARDLEGLGTSFPEMRTFRAATTFNRSRLEISYSFSSDPPQGGGGWGGATPKPRAGGVWFHLDMHDPDSRAQIHTQPMYQKLYYRGKVVMLLFKGNNELEAKIRGLLQQRGARDSPAPSYQTPEAPSSQAASPD